MIFLKQSIDSITPLLKNLLNEFKRSMDKSRIFRKISKKLFDLSLQFLQPRLSPLASSSLPHSLVKSYLMVPFTIHLIITTLPDSLLISHQTCKINTYTYTHSFFDQLEYSLSKKALLSGKGILFIQAGSNKEVVNHKQVSSEQTKLLQYYRQITRQSWLKIQLKKN